MAARALPAFFIHRIGDPAAALRRAAVVRHGNSQLQCPCDLPENVET